MEERRCPGCGAVLQTNDVLKDGFVDQNALNREYILCKRCFQLQHYGKFVKGKETYSTIKMVHEYVKKEDVVILVVDVSLINTPFLNALSELRRYPNLYLIANRYDLYQSFVKEEKAISFLKRESQKSNLHFKRIFLIHSQNEKDIITYFDQNYPQQNFCFVGLENAGKTTLINRFIKYLNPQIKPLTKSLYPGTTLQPLKIQFAENRVILDTPGIQSKTSFLNKVENKVLKQIQSDKKIVQTSFQLNEKQAIHLNNFLSFQYLEGVKQGIIFYHPALLTLTRTKLENAATSFQSLIKDYKIKTNKIKCYADFQEYEIENINHEKVDIVIEGLAMITLTHQGKFKLYTFKDSNVYLRKAMI